MTTTEHTTALAGKMVIADSEVERLLIEEVVRFIMEHSAEQVDVPRKVAATLQAHGFVKR